MKKYQNIILIILLAAVVRLAFITASPPSLYWEEAALGYDAYSILKSGQDLHGHPWPLVAFESFGDWKPSGYFYALVPFIAVFGLNEWAVRLPSALAGILTVWLTYLIVKHISKREAWAIWSSLILAIMPWHIQFSRAGFEVNLATFLLTLGVYCLILGKTRPGYLVGAMAAMVASMYTYHGLRILAPLLSGMFIIAGWKIYVKSKWFWISLGIGLILIIPIILAWNSPQIQQRINETSLFSTSLAVEMTNAERAADGNTLLARIIHHRYWFWGKEILAGSLSHFNPDFLFILGDHNNRHQTGFTALLYPWMAVPLLLGLMVIIFGRERRSWWLVGWILLATIPPALTNLTPHTLRFLPASPAMAMVIGLGMDEIWQWIFKRPRTRIFHGLVVLVVISSLTVYLYDLWFVYPKRSSQNWQYGYKEAIQAIKEDYYKDTPIMFTQTYGRPSIYALFYLNMDPKRIQQIEPQLPKSQGELLAIDNLTFGQPHPLPGMVVVSDVPLEGGALKQKIAFLDGKKAFYVYQY